jgi:hypothetical protein
MRTATFPDREGYNMELICGFINHTWQDFGSPATLSQWGRPQ